MAFILYLCVLLYHINFNVIVFVLFLFMLWENHIFLRGRDLYLRPPKKVIGINSTPSQLLGNFLSDPL